MSKCSICNSSKTTKVVKINAWDVCKCADCGLIYTYPLPSDEELNEFYQGFLFDEPKSNEVSKQVKIRENELKKHFDVRDGEKNSLIKFLDYGGGTGAMFAAAKNAGFNSYYFDIDQESVGFVQKNYNLNKTEHVTDISLSGKTYDFIWSDNVIEHVKDPTSFVQLLYNSLEPGGVLVMKTPQGANIESCFVFAISIMVYFKRAIKENSLKKSILAITKHRYWHCEPPRHLYAFSKKSIFKIAENCGIEKKNVEIKDYYLPLFRYSLLHVLSIIKPFPLQIAFAVFIIPLIIPEFILSLIRVSLAKLAWITGTGITIKITKD